MTDGSMIYTQKKQALDLVETAVHQTRKLDAFIAVALFKPKSGQEWGEFAALPNRYDSCSEGTYWLCSRSGRSLRTAPLFTSSLDAAVAAVFEHLPGWTLARIGQDDNKKWHAELRQGYQTSYNTAVISALCPAPALAVCSALLKALLVDEGERE